MIRMFVVYYRLCVCVLLVLLFVVDVIIFMVLIDRIGRMYGIRLRISLLIRVNVIRNGKFVLLLLSIGVLLLVDLLVVESIELVDVVSVMV